MSEVNRNLAQDGQRLQHTSQVNTRTHTYAHTYTHTHTKTDTGAHELLHLIMHSLVHSQRLCGNECESLFLCFQCCFLKL